MNNVRIVISLIWVATMLIFLLGDVIRIFAGDFEPGEVEGKKISSNMYLGIAAIMVMPIIMIVLSLTLDNPINKLINIVVAIVFFLFNLVGIKGYKAYDIFLLIISFGFNVLIVLIAWTQL
jgi:hypothetical protein